MAQNSAREKIRLKWMTAICYGGGNKNIRPHPTDFSTPF
jgi:hypothetical protein